MIQADERAMLVEYDPNLVEHAVFEASRQDPRIEAELHRATDPLYNLDDTRERNAAFHKTYMQFFQRLRLDHVVSRLLAERPVLKELIQQCIVRKVLGEKQELAELYVKPDGENGAGNPDGRDSRTIQIHACARSLWKPTLFCSKMRRELLQIADMVDQRFGYQKDSLIGGLPRQNLIRDRYRILWDAYAQSRLMREGYRDDDAQVRLATQFKRVFSLSPSQIVKPALEKVLAQDTLTHDDLMRWATWPKQLFGLQSHRDLDEQAAAGEPCPVCGCSTFDWYQRSAINSTMKCSIQRDFPEWHADEDICRQCAEIYSE